jgi:hypothetical protein
MNGAPEVFGGKVANFIGFVFDVIVNCLMYLGCKRLGRWVNCIEPRKRAVERKG